MKIYLHIGLPHCGAEQLQKFLGNKRGQLAKKSVLFPQSPGRKNHTRLFMAMTDPDNVDPLRYFRGHGAAAKQAELRDKLLSDLGKEIDKVNPKSLILSAHQLGGCLVSDRELTRLRDFAHKFSKNVTVVMHLDEQARVLVAHYAENIMQGRVADLTQELSLKTGSWFDAAIAARQPLQPQLNQFPDVQAPPFWLDYKALVARWAAVFGADALRLRPYNKEVFDSDDLMAEATSCFDLPSGIGKGRGGNLGDLPSDMALARARAMNGYGLQVMEKGLILDRQLLIKIAKSVSVDGPKIDPAGLFEISDRFAKDNAELMTAFPVLAKAARKVKPAPKPWSEPNVGSDLKPHKIFEPFKKRIETLTAEHREEVAQKAPPADFRDFLSKTGARLLPNAAKKEVAKLAVGRFKPRNDIGKVDETAVLAQYSSIKPRKLDNKSTGNVIVGCMKNEAPYIIEWIAYHRAIGVDNFIIYTNDCSDGTTEILDRLQEMGVIVHENNDNWKGNSPQQAALNRAIKHPLMKKADWVTHIDVDEFINVRFGNGTLPEFIERVGDATNVAMTWRLFGHNGVSKLADELVIGQFDHAAPKFCPKPHTVWGFKTLYRNINAYEKISCHRTTKLRENKRDDVKWVNGNGAVMAGGIADNGWRSSLKTIGYDLIQLNHYALRSAESYLIKRQRGRALHVDRSIGINYWLRMDFNSHQDVTIQRNMDRTSAEVTALKGDAKLLSLHKGGLEWHNAKAAELHKMPEFEDLYKQALDLDLNDIERVAWCLVNDLES